MGKWHPVFSKLATIFPFIIFPYVPEHDQENIPDDLTLCFQLQTKFTSISGQDPDNLPYDPTSPLPTQVEKSIESSLTNFRPETSLESTSSSYIDSLILHSPLPTIPQTVQVWSTLEKFVPHTIRSLGIANINLPTLKSIVSSSIVKPSFVQNRFYEDTAYDVELREFCKANGIVYQSFWTLTANPRLMKSEVVGEVAKKLDLERAVALYGLVLGLGGQWEVVVLDGTTREERMVGDLKGVDTLMSWAKEFPKEWEGFMLRFKRLIDEVE